MMIWILFQVKSRQKLQRVGFSSLLLLFSFILVRTKPDLNFFSPQALAGLQTLER